MWPSTGSRVASRSGSEGPTPGGRAAGFTLIEVLVAFVILSLALAALLPGFSSGLRSLEVSEQYDTAALLAESRLAAVGREAPLAAGRSSGEFENGFRWHLDVLPLDELDPDLGVQAYHVVLTVSWDAPEADRSITLETLRLGSGDEGRP